ncbi:HIT family protein [Arhodomonas sp. KWT2]|nr:HIT family protein [Arhodomonas sp. KWT]
MSERMDGVDGTEWNATMRKFGAPDTCIRNYTHWSVLLRPRQATLGALVLAAREPAQAFPELSAAAFSELRGVTADIEQALQRAFSYERLNYLMLMMVDPDVHFHVLPRYPEPQTFDGREFEDRGWPGPPDLSHVNETNESANARIIEHIASCWP